MQYPEIEKLSLKLGIPVTVFDIETSNFRGTPNFGIVQCALLTLLGGKGGVKAVKKVNPECAISLSASKVHGITDADVANEATWRRFAPIFKTISNQHLAVGYNIKAFDCPAVVELNAKYGEPLTSGFVQVLDVYTLVSKFYKRMKLEVACQELGIVPSGAAHDALVDVMMTADVLEKILAEFGIDAVLEHLVKEVAKPEQIEVPEQYAKLVSGIVDGSIQSVETALQAVSAKSIFDKMILIGSAMDEGYVNGKFLAEVPEVAWITAELPNAVAKVWEGVPGKLKPLLDALKENKPEFLGDLNYIYLRAALLNKGMTWSTYSPK